MERKTSRNLYLTGIVLFIVATVLLVGASGAAVATANPDGTISTGTGTGLGILAIVSTLLFIVGGILATIAWVGALIKTARLGQWMWFVLLLIFSGITMLIYIFAGPTQPKAVAAPSM